MAKQLNVNLDFTADTSKAKSAIDELKKSLNDVAKLPGSSKALFDDSSLKAASKAAMDLKGHLEEATNVDTGKIDLSRLSLSLKASNKNLGDYYSTLLKAGDEGKTAFLQVAKAVAQADAPMAKMNSKLAEMQTVLKNTVKWQISSSFLHGAMGTISSAYNYAKDLNESLNNIRIVTGQSNEQMVKFAASANKAAKELNTTTTRYSNASLIYYQQGLSDQEVKKRTDITIKMSNVARENAQVVSDQLTSVWNNFYKQGGPSLESYADGMTALGAATASSTSEIAEGLNKFAAIADTVGLSFDYAAAGLATVTSTTRQSADVVGTAFKTMFARIQGLELGKTLDDGTTLNKYSQALHSVGVDIKDGSGNLKDMDLILDEMAEKWNTLRKDEQVALAETVAGTRQYTQLMALMNNWDFMKENLETVKESEGALNQQAEIFAESWEAASNKVRASAEGIYTDLFDDTFFISLTKGFGGFLEIVDKVSSGLGGLKGIAGLTSAFLLKTYGNKLPEAFRNLKMNIYSLIPPLARREERKVIRTTQEHIGQMEEDPSLNRGTRAELKGSKSLLQRRSFFLENSNSWTAQQKKNYNLDTENLGRIYDDYTATQNELQENEKNYVDWKRKLRQTLNVGQRGQTSRISLSDFNKDIDQIQNKSLLAQEIEDIKTEIKQKSFEWESKNPTTAKADLIRYAKSLKSVYFDKFNPKALGEDLGNKNAWRQIRSGRTALDSLLSGLQSGKVNSKELWRNFTDSLESNDELLGSEFADYLEGEIEKDLRRVREKYHLTDTEFSQLQQQTTGSFVENKAKSIIQERNISGIETENEQTPSKESPMEEISQSDDQKRQPKAWERVKNWSKGNDWGGAVANLSSAATAGYATFASLEQISSLVQEGSHDWGAYGGAAVGGLTAAAQAGLGFKKGLEALQVTSKIATGATFGLGAALLGIYGLVKLYDKTHLNAEEALDDQQKANEKVKTSQQNLDGILSNLESVQSKIAEIESNGISIEDKTDWSRLQKELSNLEIEKTIAEAELHQAKMQSAATFLDQEHQKVISESLKPTEIETKKPYRLDAYDSQGQVITQGTLEISPEKFKQLYLDPLLVNNNDTNKELDYDDQIRENNISEELYKILTTGNQYDLKQGSFLPQENNQGFYSYKEGSPQLISDISSSPAYIEYQRILAESEKNRIAGMSTYYTELEGFQNLVAMKDAYGEDVIEDSLGYISEIGKKVFGEAEYQEKVVSQLDKEFAKVETAKDIFAKVDDSEAFTKAFNDNSFLKEASYMRGIAAEDYRQYLLDQKEFLADQIAGENAGEKEKQDAQNTLSELLASDQFQAEDFEILFKIGLEKNDNVDDILSKIENYRNGVEIPLRITENFSEAYGTIQKLKKGGNISDKDYAKIIGFDPSLEEQFIKDAIGGYKFTGDPEKLQEYMKEALTSEISRQRDLVNKLSKSSESAEVEEGEPVGADFSPDRWAEAKDFSNDNKEKTAARDDFVEEFKGTEDGMAILEALGYKDFEEVAQLEGDSLTQFYQGMEDFSSGEIVNQDQIEQLISITDSINELNTLLSDGTISNEQYAQSLEMVSQQEAISKGFSAEDFESYRDIWKETNAEIIDSNKLTDASINQLVISSMRMDRAVKNFQKNGKEISKVLKAGVGQKTTSEINNAAEAVGDLAADLLDIKKTDLSSKFKKDAKNFELLEKAINGDTEALNEYRTLAAQDIVTNFALDDNKINEAEQAMINKVAEIGELAGDVEIGVSLDKAGLTNAMESIIAGMDMTAEQANAFLEGIGFEPNVEMVPVHVSGEVKEANGKTYVDVIDPITGDPRRVEGEYGAVGDSIDTTINIPVVNGNSAKKGAPSGGGGGKGGGGGGKKPKKTKVSRKPDMFKRYKEKDDRLDNNKRQLEDLNDLSDRLYGPNRIKQMEKINDLLEKEVELNKAKKKEALDYLKIDKDRLKEDANKAGVDISFNAAGDITNYTEVMDKLAQEIIDAQNAANEDGDASEDEMKNIAEMTERFEDLKKSIEQYDETKELIQDLDKEIQDKIYEMQDNNMEALRYKLEFQLEINEDELKVLEYFTDKLADNFYKMAESAALLKDKFKPLNDNMSQLAAHQKELIEAYTNKDETQRISQEDFAEGMKEVRDKMLENLSALNNLDKEMAEYYSNTLAAAGEELGKYTSRMEHQTSVLEHYRNIMELMGKPIDYDALDKNLVAQAKTMKNQLEVATKSYQMYSDEASKWQEKMKSVDQVANPQEYETYKKNWEAAVEAQQEAHEEMLSQTESYMEQLQSIIENKFQKLNENFTNGLLELTSFQSLEEMNIQAERANKLQDDYLTTTNKVYETNKLMRTAQQAIDETTNKVAKNKLKGFIDETKALQEQGELSKFELDIQQAKYNLLVAEIALQEAQDAKSQVRLSRDSEGNFSYIYTADQEKVNEAQQKYEDAQNDLYNKALEGSKDFAERYRELLNEISETQAELREKLLNKEITKEEYDHLVENSQEYYKKQLESLSHLYEIGLNTDNRIVDGLWDGDEDLMNKVKDSLESNSFWEDLFNKDKVDTDKSYQDWQDELKKITIDFDSEISKIESSNDKLKDTTLDLIENSLKPEIEEVGTVTEAYAKLRDTIIETLKAYEELVKNIQKDIEVNIEIRDGMEKLEEEERRRKEEEERKRKAEILQQQEQTKREQFSNKNLLKKDSFHFYAPGEGDNIVHQLPGGQIISKYDTGGYTGEWGPQGKLAVLHEKEIVLNKEDTKNLLVTVSMMDQILSVLDASAKYASIGLGALTPGEFKELSSQEINQNITIQADFPNAINHSEIEEAFKNLTVQASQFANRKN